MLSDTKKCCVATLALLYPTLVRTSTFGASSQSRQGLPERPPSLSQPCCIDTLSGDYEGLTRCITGYPNTCCQVCSPALPTEQQTPRPTTLPPTHQPTYAPTQLPTQAPITKEPTTSPTQLPTTPHFCCSHNYGDCDATEWCDISQANCEGSCDGIWLQEGQCQGATLWEECNSDTDCCGPATCQGNEWYMQCEPSSPTSVPTLRPTSGPTPGLTSAPSSNPSGLPTLAPTEVSPFPLLGVRTIDGTDREDDLGASHETLMRMALTPEMGYIDAVGDMNHLLPNPRNISNMVSAQRSTSTNARGMSDMIWSWGQFIDHDIGLTQHGDSFGSADVTIPQSDSNDVFVQAGCTDISFGRSQFEGGGTSIRSQVNMITSFLDASMVYGSDYDRANYLRTMTDGLLKTSDNGRMLPFNDGNFHNEGGDGDTNLYLAGDVRANEQAGLTAMHTLFVREHNRLAGIIKEKYPAASDEDIYQLARKIVGAEIQIITYKEFLPALMGPNAPNPDDENLEFDARVSPSVANEFSAFAFRFGHSMLSSSLKLADADGEIGTVLLRNIFFNPDFFKTAERGSTNVDHLLLGFLRQHAQEIDTQIVDDVRNFLFSTPAGPGTCLDLAVLNIQRGRDHGLLNCNMFREQMGLGRHYSFASVTSDEELQIKLSLAYNGQVDDIDAWVCALAEDHVDGASIGPLLMYVLHDQFYRLMVGDPFFYKWDADLEAVQQTGLWDEGQVSLATVIQQNTIGNPTGNAFFV